MPEGPELTLELTPKVIKVTADVELYAGGHCVGTTTVDLTPKPATQQTPHADHLQRHSMQQTFPGRP